MKTKMSLSAEMDLTQDSVVQLTCWCGQIALHAVSYTHLTLPTIA